MDNKEIFKQLITGNIVKEDNKYIKNIIINDKKYLSIFYKRLKNNKHFENNKPVYKIDIYKNLTDLLPIKSITGIEAELIFDQYGLCG